jgi:AcrR family transcriptional regulator
MQKRESKENRKEDIFAAAVTCFNKNGYYKTSMDMIAESANMTKRGLYYHFKSKDELFIELFHYMNKKYYSQIPPYASQVSDPEERMLMFLKIANTVLKENTDFLKFSHEFMSIGIRKPAIREVMSSYYSEQVEKVKRIVDNGIQSGQFAPVDSEKMARAIVLITIGAFNTYFTLNAAFNLAEQHNFNILHLLKGLKNGRPSQ